MGRATDDIGTAAWIARTAERIAGSPVTGIDRPGGAGRGSVGIVLADGRRLIATRRATPARTANEALVLRALSGAGAPVPRLVGHEAGLLLQERIEGRRLSEAFADPEADHPELAAAAVTALEGCRRRLARMPQVSGRLPGLGTRPGWTDDFVARPAFLSNDLRIAPPAVEFGALARALEAPPARPTRWDARSGNAIVRPGGQVVWIDWEVVGLRAGVEDVAGLLACEHWPLGPEASRLALREGRAEGGARTERMAVLLAAHRLAAIHRKVRRDGWADDGARARREDRIGATPAAVARLAARAAALAEGDPVGGPFADWFARADEALRGTDPQPA